MPPRISTYHATGWRRWRGGRDIGGIAYIPVIGWATPAAARPLKRGRAAISRRRMNNMYWCPLWQGQRHQFATVSPDEEPRTIRRNRGAEVVRNCICELRAARNHLLQPRFAVLDGRQVRDIVIMPNRLVALCKISDRKFSVGTTLRY